MKCKSCGRKKELRFGHCFQCADIESVIVSGVNMYDKGLGANPAIKGFHDTGNGVKAKSGLEKVQLLVELGYIKFND